MKDAPAEVGNEPLEENLGIEQASEPYIGRWNRLVSTTNWEKGRIIFEWRDALVIAAAPAAEYSDEAWSRRVGGVTGQHAGRLRRAYQRFGQVFDQYPSLHWSHFQAALDWGDAEMWLEGAVQSRWSVSHMRRQRWETLGAVEGQEPRDDEIVASEVDEDFEPALHESPADQVLTGDYAEVQGPLAEGPDFGDDEQPSSETPQGMEEGASIDSDDDQRETVKFVRPFEHLAELPDDLAEAFETFKLTILRHKSESWQQISRDDVLASLDALKELVSAPSTDTAP